MAENELPNVVRDERKHPSPKAILTKEQTMSKNIKTIPTQDYNDVVAIVSTYVDGLRIGSIENCRQRIPRRRRDVRIHQR